MSHLTLVKSSFLYFYLNLRSKTVVGIVARFYQLFGNNTVIRLAIDLMAYQAFKKFVKCCSLKFNILREEDRAIF
jgi:hypothetical protein